MQIPTPISGDLSLYIHLPFCKKKCDYCHFYVIPDKDYFKDLLLGALLKEIETKKTFLASKKIISIYFGGGTPSLVGPSYLKKLLGQLKKSGAKIHSDVEVTLEINPENFGAKILRDFKEAGINRLSVGAQSFNDPLLKKLGREHSASDIYKCVDLAKENGFKNISIDLMYELPGQTFDDWDHTLNEALRLPSSHLSLYNLSIEKNTVFYKHREKISSQMPTQQQGIDMYLLAQKKFEEKGFRQYEISAFCQSEQYSRHNVGYWHQRDHLGFGPSAFSLIGLKRFQNSSHIQRYVKALEKKHSPIDYQEQLDPKDFLKESLALHLRLKNGFDLKNFQQRFGIIEKDTFEILRDLEKKGFLSFFKDSIHLTHKGTLNHDEIASMII